MRDRSRARQLAAEYLAKGDPTGWFEPLYREAEEGAGPPVPWADLRPNPNLLDFWRQHPIPAIGRTALKIGCGLGDDAEQLARWGFSVTAFDISESAIRGCHRRFPQSQVQYLVANLLDPPREWSGRFDFVLEAYTIQVLPHALLRESAMQHVAGFVSEGGKLLVIARARDEDQPHGEMPWPLTRGELNRFADLGLSESSFEDYQDPVEPDARRFRALYSRPKR